MTTAGPANPNPGRTGLPRVARRLLLAAVAANLLPAALLFFFVYRFGVDLPMLDEWDALLIPLQRFNQGTLDFSALIAQHNEHRMLFPRLLTLLNASLFAWNRTAEMYVSVALLILCTWFLFRFVRKYWAHPLTPLLFLPIAWTLLGWRQWENLLLGIGTVFTLLAAGAVFAFCLLHRTRGGDRFVYGAAAAAFVASFSSGGGLLIWPIGLAQLALQRRAGKRDGTPGPAAFVVWTAVGIATWSLFFIGYQQRPASWPTGFAYVVQNPLTTLRYVFTMIGGPLSDQQPAAQTLGLIVTCVGAWAFFRLARVKGGLVAAAPLLSLIALTLLTAAIGCDRRMGMGIGQATSSRYCSVTMLALVAVYALCIALALLEKSPVALLASGGMIALLVFGAITSLVSNYDPARLTYVPLATYAVRYAEVTGDDAVSWVYPNPDIVRERVGFLRAHGYSLFHKPAPPGLPNRYLGADTGCSIDSINGKGGPVADIQQRKDHGGVRVEGWAVDSSAPQGASQLFVSIDRRIDAPSVYGMARPDVARVFSKPGYASSGFVTYLRTSLLATGEHTLELKIVTHDGAAYHTCGAALLRVGE